MMPSQTTASQLRAALEKKNHISNPISRLIESGQACKHLVTFRKKDCPGLEIIFQVVCQELVVEGRGRTNKEAKIKAALNLIEHVENGDIVENVVESTENVTEPQPQPAEPVSHAVPDSRATWPACLELLTDEEKDWVKGLAIFAFNTDTGRPKYKVMKVVKDMPGFSKYKVLCTWNLFFLEGEGVSRGDAEQEAAMKMMNKVRTLCGMKEVERKLSHGGDIENVDSSDRILTDQMRTVMVKHSNMLADITLRGVVKLLDTFSSKVNSPSPIYNIIDVTTSGSLAMVEVTCKWITLITRGKGSSKVMAEQKAALAMIKKIKEIMKQKELSDSLNVNETGEAVEPVQYLVYPGHGQARAQANVTITSRDYLCLQEEQFLNDVIIDFYLKYLQTGLFSDNHLMEKTYTFSIYFYKRLTMNTKCSTLAMSQAEVMHSNVKKWTKNVNIFEKDFIVVPINDCDHWFVIIICYPALISTKEEDGRVMKPLMLVLDSLEDGLKDKVCEDLRSYLTSEWKEKMKSTRKFSSSNMPSFCPKIPQQDNLTDCGLFLLEYVESFYNDPIINFSTPLTSLANWFTMEKVNRKREDIAMLIRDLTTNQETGKVFTFPDIGFSGELKPDVNRDKLISTEETLTKKPDSISLAKPATKIKLNLKPKPLLNAKKCHILHLGGRNARYEYTMEGRLLEPVEFEKDVGVIVHQSMKPSMQCAKAAARANGILGQLSRAVCYRDKDTFLKLYKVYVRPHLEYAVVSWSPWTQQDKEVLEKVQRRAVGMVSNMRGRSYEERLAEAGMMSLEDRRLRGDMITTYRIMTGKDRVEPGVFFGLAEDVPGVQTRQAAHHHIRAQPVKPKLDIRRYSFSQRVITTWNMLPDNLKEVGTVLQFKIGYDAWVGQGRLGAH